ncbi:MAG: hypothetical protein HZA50_02980 [Planctomycetes bacterium]|nr:hypothetical protein [Planctomycetota bacterium]
MKFFRWLATPVPVLMILSPSIGELLCGSAPPAEFFNPVGMAMLVILYGGGAVLVRELVFRWKAGLLSLLILGAAYGIIEEGLMVKSFTDPNWPDLVSGLGHYGRWIEVNWVWTSLLTFYHAIFSITVPVLLVGLIFPAWRQRAWLNGRKFMILLALFVLDGVFIYFFISKHTPPVLQYLFFAAITAGLVLLARRLAGASVRADALWRPSTGLLATPGPSLKKRFTMWLTGFFTGWMIFLTTFGSKSVGLPPLSAIILQITFIGGGIYGAYCLAWGSGGFTDRMVLSLASGLLWVLIPLSVMQEFDRSRPDNTTGMAVVGFAFAVGLWLLGRKLKKSALLASQMLAEKPSA